jgi:flagellar biosynthesis GTPase FlhF
MPVRKFFAVKSHVAMEKVRNTMHSGAHILSVKKVQGGVEVLVDGDLVDITTLESNLAQLNNAKQIKDKNRTQQ